MADTFGTVSTCVGMGSTCGGCGPGSTIGCGCSGRSRSPGGACKGLWGGWGSWSWASWMTKGGSTTATLPIAGSVDDKMVPAISAARTEIADFLVHFCSRWNLACTVDWTVWSPSISALTMSRDRLSLYRWETLFTSIPSPECTGRKEPHNGPEMAKICFLNYFKQFSTIFCYFLTLELLQCWGNELNCKLGSNLINCELHVRYLYENLGISWEKHKKNCHSRLKSCF
jgi:hypothetical protein